MITCNGTANNTVIGRMWYQEPQGEQQAPQNYQGC